MTGFNKILTYSGSAIIVMLLASGCLKNDWEEKEQHEKEVIQKYLEDNNISEDQKTEGGIYFVEEKAGTGLSPQTDNYIIIDYVGRYLEDNAIRETTYDSLKDEWTAAEYFEYYVYGPVKFKFGYTIAGMNEGLALMKEGGKALMVLPSDKAFYDFNPMAYEVELYKVISDPVSYEDSVLLVYRNEKGFDESTKYGWSNGDTIWFKETVTPDPTDERTVEPNDTVLFRFTGRLVDGFGNVVKDDRVFDSNTSDTNPVRIVYNRTNPTWKSGHILAIPGGLTVALDSMRVGTHATAVLPYDQAFDISGITYDPYGYTIVPPYQTVVYDIIVVDIRSPGK